MQQAAGLSLEGTVERVTFYNPESGFSVIRLRVRGRREPVAVVGALPAAQPGELLSLTGVWRTDPRHGAQFQPTSAEIRRPSDLEGIRIYLGSGLIRQIGPVLADRIVAAFGERTLDILDADPERVREVQGIGRQRAHTIAAAWVEHRSLRGIVAFLSTYRLDIRFAKRLLDAYGEAAPRTLAANPYRLVGEVKGLGFAAADRIGESVGVPARAAARLQAAVLSALVEAGEAGHTRMAWADLATAATAHTGVDPALIDAAITQQMAREAIAIRATPVRQAPRPSPVDGTQPALMDTDGTTGAAPRRLASLQAADTTHVRGGDAPLRPAWPVASGSGDMGRAEAAFREVPGQQMSGRAPLPLFAPATPAAHPSPNYVVPGGDDPRTPQRPLTTTDHSWSGTCPGTLRVPSGSGRARPGSSGLGDPQPIVPSTPGRRLTLHEPAPVAADEDDGPGLGLDGLVRAEEDLARRLLELAARPGLDAGAVDAWLAGDSESRALSDEQRYAVCTAACSGLFVLTGGPGVGKTTTTRALVRLLAALGRDVTLAAPTGKAAKRLGEVVGAEARTLHRLLGVGPEGKGFRHGPREPLRHDVVIVDECSMLDTQLARSIVRAVGPAAQLILVGDADQLPSVGPGQVLRDLLAGGAVPSVALTTVFRQAARSGIVVNAHRIRGGELPLFAAPHELEMGADCIFVPAAPAGLAAIGAEWAASRLPAALGVAPGEVQALAPLIRVCQSVNETLQERLNPAQGQAERPHGALALRVGDRVIQTRNNYNLGVFNGDTGILAAVDADGLSVDFGDERLVEYSGSDLLDLDHAYCLTVHRSQGSEWAGVVLLAHSSYGGMLTRNLLYTALTRARKAVVVVGDEAGIARAVAETRDLQRRTGLGWLLDSGTRDAGR